MRKTAFRWLRAPAAEGAGINRAIPVATIRECGTGSDTAADARRSPRSGALARITGDMGATWQQGVIAAQHLL